MQGMIRVTLFGTSREVGVPLSRVLRFEEPAEAEGVTLHFARGRQVRIAGDLRSFEAAIAAACGPSGFGVGQGAPA